MQQKKKKHLSKLVCFLNNLCKTKGKKKKRKLSIIYSEHQKKAYLFECAKKERISVRSVLDDVSFTLKLKLRRWLTVIQCLCRTAVTWKPPTTTFNGI